MQLVIELLFFCESVELLGNEQAGFRKNFSTCDHIFALYALISIYTKCAERKLYCCFVDYKKAFDSVPRVHLWYKLLTYGINGKVLNVIKSLYGSAKSAIKLNLSHSLFFNCDIGVRQCDNLSPLLFVLYLNDLQDHLAKAYNGLQTSCNLIQKWVQDEDTVVFLKLFTILYADDTVIFAESRPELQAALHGMMHYCNLWKMSVNSQKTKVVIYGSKGKHKEPDFKLGDLDINVVSEYCYLGIRFPSNNNFSKGISRLKNQANRAMFSLIKKSRSLGLDIDVQLHLFDSIIVPIATYGCEIWGFKNIEILEKLHLQYCKILLRVKKCTPNVMVLGELGRLPIDYNVKSRMLGFWYKLVSGNNCKISVILYKLLMKLHQHNIFSADWIVQMENTMNECGLSDYWNDNNLVRGISYVNFKKIYKDKLRKLYTRRWLDLMENSSKCSLYRNFKTELKFDKYLTA